MRSFVLAGVLTKRQRDAGLRLVEELEDAVNLWDDQRLVASWDPLKVTVAEIQKAADDWLVSVGEML